MLIIWNLGIYPHVFDALQEFGIEFSGAHFLEGVPFPAPAQPVSPTTVTTVPDPAGKLGKQKGKEK